MQKVYDFGRRSLEQELSGDLFLGGVNACVEQARNGFEANFKVFIDPRTNDAFYSPQIYLYEKELEYTLFEPEIIGFKPDFYLDFPNLDFRRGAEICPMIPIFIDFYTSLRADFLNVPLFAHLDELNSHRANNKCLSGLDGFEILRPLGIILDTKTKRKEFASIKFYFENTPRAYVLNEGDWIGRFSKVGGTYNLKSGEVLDFPNFYDCGDLIRYDNADDEFEDC